MKSRIVKGSNVPSINLSKEIIAVLSRLDADEVKEIIVGIRDYVYKDKEPKVNEEITDIMDMTLDNINHIAKGYLNGKKGGRPRKTQPQQDVKEEATEISHISPSEGIKKENDIQIPNEDLKLTEAIKSTINGILPNEFMDGLENATEKSNITTEDIKEIMGNYIGEVEKLNNKTTGENSNFDFEGIDRLIPKINKEMVLKQIKPYLSKEKNIGRLNDVLSIFLKDVSLDDRTKYYEFLLEQSFAVA